MDTHTWELSLTGPPTAFSEPAREYGDMGLN